jgi:putative acetyltransferase
MPEIRAELPSDADGIRVLNRQAFKGDAEAKLVDLLRERGRNIVSLVAVEDGQVVGQVLFTEVSVTPTASYKGVGLAPMAVLPGFQNRGIGTELGTRGLSLCRDLGYDFAVVLGHTDYYPRFGFKKASDFSIGNDYEVDDPFMALEFKPGILGSFKGVAHYAPEFAETGS